MKTNEIKKMVEQVVRTEYVAEDGTVFYNKEECEIYEKSALCAINSKLKRLCGNGTSQAALLDFGFDEDIVEIFDVQTEEDLENLRRYLYLRLIQNSKEEVVQKALTPPKDSNLNTATALYNITAGHEVIILWNYEFDYAWTYGDGSLNGYFDHIRKNYELIIAPEKVKKEGEK